MLDPLCPLNVHCPSVQGTPPGRKKDRGGRDSDQAEQGGNCVGMYKRQH